MNWRIEFSNKAEKFARNHNLLDKVQDLIIRFLKTREGHPGAPDYKFLKGKWKGYYRIRLSDVRILFKLDRENRIVYIEAIDRRDKVYRK
jgi:mRNA-degrading endonuclease RelE of RelBE toxin-antitoxin system